MRIREGMRLRKIVDEWIVVPDALNMADVSALFSLNETGVFLWKHLETGCTYDECLELMCKEYGIAREQAEPDLKEFIDLLESYKLICG